MKNPSLYSPLLYFKIWTLVDLGEGPVGAASPLIFRPIRGPRPEEPNTFVLETAPDHPPTHPPHPALISRSGSGTVEA